MIYNIKINRLHRLIYLMAALILFISACKNNPNNPNQSGDNYSTSKTGAKILDDEGAAYKQVNLVSDISGFNALRTDANLVNAWGIAISPTGIFWISANGTGLSVVYDTLGNQKRTPVTIPSATSSSGGAPSGVVYNSTASDFVIPANNEKSKFIFAQEDGILSAWSSGNSAIKVADRSAAGAVYKGLAIGAIGSSNYIFATDFHNNKVDVFDNSFNYVSSITFSDPNIPSNFAPFNIANIDGYLYVTYAKQKPPDNHDDLAGQGNGFIDVYQTDGTLVKRFATRGQLNSPWGIVKAPSGFGVTEGSILVGNFGDGIINIYSASGTHKGFLRDSNSHKIQIDGLWGLFFITNSSIGNTHWLYFSAGPNGESDGLFGYLTKVQRRNGKNDDD